MTKTPKRPTKPTRRQRRHGDLPAGFKWRDGRPRWEPSPTRRRQGWKGADLKDARGAWLAKGAAIDRAQAIGAAIEAWAAGAQVPAGMAAFAPAGSCAAPAPGAGVLGPRSIGALLDAYKAHRAFTDLAPRTQADYANKLDRFLQVLAASPADDADKVKTKIGALRAESIDTLSPPPFDAPDGEVFELEHAYDVLIDLAGDHMANGVMACVSAWLGWCVKKRRVWATNPAQLVSRKTLDGRIVVYDWAEIEALVRAADTLGRASIGDAIVLAIDLSWSQQDLLALDWGQVSPDHHVRGKRLKTGNVGNPQLLPLGQARMDLIRARWAGAKVRPTHVLVCEMTGRAWAADTFRHEFALVRAAAAKTAPGVLAKQFRDLRDTSITYCIEAGLGLEETCSRTLHSPDRAQAVISKHYGAIRQGVADEGAKKLAAHFARMGYRIDPVLALPAPVEGEG